jgi:hypothetical protein
MMRLKRGAHLHGHEDPWGVTLTCKSPPFFAKLPTGFLPKVPVHANSEQVWAIRHTASHQAFLTLPVSF